MDELEAVEDVFETLKSWTNVHCKKEVFTEPKPKKVQKEESFDPDWQYNMRHRERGCFVIFNQKVQCTSLSFSSCYSALVFHSNFNQSCIKHQVYVLATPFLDMT